MEGGDNNTGLYQLRPLKCRDCAKATRDRKKNKKNFTFHYLKLLFFPFKKKKIKTTNYHMIIVDEDDPLNKNCEAVAIPVPPDTSTLLQRSLL